MGRMSVSWLNKHQSSRSPFIIIALAVVLVVVAWPRPTQAGASLKITPVAGVYEVGSLVDVSFMVDTGGEAINAVRSDVLFPADKLQVVNPAASTSFITLWIQAPTYSNVNGTISFQGGLPNPGIKTSAGVISTVTFRVKSPGRAVIKFSNTSQVLRNDGQGTNILTSTASADYELKVPPPAGPEVMSPTHGDHNQWYNNNQIQFTWTAIEGAVGYSYVFDQNSKTIPDEKVTTISTSTGVKATADGVWYFHLRALTENWGGVTTFPVQIDTTPPAAFTSQLDRALLTTEETGALRFVTTDAASGIDHYELKQIDQNAGQTTANTLFVETNNPYEIPKLAAGEYEFIVRVVDRAGNDVEGSAHLKVVKSGLPFFARVPFLRNPAIANLALIILAVIALFSLVWWLTRRFRLSSTFKHDLEALEHDAQRKSEALRLEMEELRQAQAMMYPPPPPPGNSLPPLRPQ